MLTEVLIKLRNQTWLQSKKASTGITRSSIDDLFYGLKFKPKKKAKNCDLFYVFCLIRSITLN